MRHIAAHAQLATHHLSAGGLYFIARCAYDAKRLRDSRAEAVHSAPKAIYVLPVVCSDALFALLTTAALRGTLATLRSKGSNLRLNIYRVYSAALGCTAVFCAGYLSFEAYFHATQPQNEKWQFEWVRDH